MITKIISCADIHVPALKGIDDLKVVLKEFIKKCKAIVKKEKDPNKVRIVIAGDIFHNKIQITPESMMAVNWFFKELDGICKTIILIGNHDMLMNNTGRIDSLSPIFEIGSYNQVVFIDKELGYKSGIYYDENIAWCLYSSFDSFNVPEIESAKVANKGKENNPNLYVGLIHGDVNGAITTTNRITENGLDPNIFEQCDFVIAGHIHKRQEIKKNGVRIVYCSSIMQQNMGESVGGHGFVLWDTEDVEDVEYKFVDIPNNNHGYYKFEVESMDDILNDKEELINY